jgi:hypothetical protein
MINPSHESLVRVKDYNRSRAHKTRWLAAVFGLASVLGLQATVLDDFNSATRTGWTDTPNGGHLTQSGGQLQVTTAASASALTYGTKTSQSFANAANQTLEFRVDVNAVTPGSGNPNPVAILSWLPSGAAPGSGSSGYSLSVNSGGATLQKGSTVLATASYTANATNIQSTTLVLRMTPSGGSLSVNARVYHQTGSQPMQNFTEVWETTQTVSDSVGTPGYAALAVRSGASASGAAVDFDNLQVFALTDTIVDDFSGGASDLSNYSVSGYGSATITGGQLELATISGVGTVYNAARRKQPNFQLADGSRLEISVDIANNVTGGDPQAFGALSFIPDNGDAGVGSLLGYHIGAGTFGLSIGKAYSEWWVNQEVYSPPGPAEPIPASNVRLIINMTGEGTSARIESRVEDLSVSVNDPARVLYQNVFVDSPAADPLDLNTTPHNPDGAGLPAGSAPYLSPPYASGSLVLYAFYGGETGGSDVVFDNLAVNQTTPGNLPPAFNNVSPPDGSNFVTSAASVSFNVNDDANTPIDNIILTLNGVRYTNGSPGVSITGANQNRLFTLAGALAPDTYYGGTLQATDSAGATTTQRYSLDTFRTDTCYVVESEDYNYGSGQSIEPYNGLVNQYIGVNGTPDVDFHDNRTGPDGANMVYRQDPPRNNITADGPRAKYVLASASPAEVVVIDRQNGDWMNYTHNYPAGYYTACMRMSQYLLPQSLITLERVTSDPTQLNQTTAVLGSFLGLPYGYDVNRDVPLTDAFGNLLVVHFAGGVDTFRVNNQIVQASNTELWQNYLVFVPAASPGSLPPFVAALAPLPGSVVGTGATGPSATIVNRDSSVVAGSVIVEVNGAVVPSSASATATGANVTWTPLATTPTLTNTLIFKDNLNVWQTNTWTYTYAVVLEATNSLPLGSLTVQGFGARLVQSFAANLGGSGGLPNGVASAQAVLAIPPQYPVDLTATNLVQLVAWDINPNFHYGAVTNFPGMCLPPASGNSFAVETYAYMQLTAGAHRFYVDSDDAVGVYSGANLSDTSTVLTQNDGVTHTSFDFLVPADGLYPFHIIFEQGGGDAYLVLKSVNLSDNSQTLLNAPGGVNTFYYAPEWVCMSSSSATGPYTALTVPINPTVTTTPVSCDGTGEALNLAPTVTGGTITIPNITGSAQFYRVVGPRSSRITSAQKTGTNLVITFLTP